MADFLDTLGDEAPAGPGPGSAPSGGVGAGGNGMALMDVSIDIVAVLGTAELKISQILQLGRGAVVELERLIGEPVELRAERQLVARGEVVVIEDKLAVQITEVIKNKL
ncbi:MAG: FliM/FliN family flagellar motor switch protein [Rhodospirillaceae bacterium]|jgi:flagellar motor switch protein FliN/FliY